MPLDRRNGTLRSACAGAAAISAALLLCAAPRATGTTAVLGISASVAANCAISATALSFGQYESVLANATSPLNAEGSVSIACTKGTAPRISMDLGQNSSAGKRYMALVVAASAGAAGTLYYELYQPPSPTAGAACSFPGSTLWGSSAGETFVPGLPLSRAARTYSVCGTIPPGQFVAMGTYADTVVATVNF
jgi:spore coat protein U domain-containing protein, fimbrial subunit CupE1/2/3/6